MTEEQSKEVPDTASGEVTREEGHAFGVQGDVQAADVGSSGGEKGKDGLGTLKDENHESPDSVLSPGLGSKAFNPEVNTAIPSAPVAASNIRGDSPAARAHRDHLNNLSLLRPHTCPAQGSTGIRGPTRTLHLPGPACLGLSATALSSKDQGRPHSNASRSQSPRCSVSAQRFGIPGYLATPGEQYATPPALVLRSHGGAVEGQLQYQFGKVAPLGPAYSSAWVCDPPQRPLVSDFRLQPSQRSFTCYSPEFVLQSVCLGGWASPQHTRPGTAQTPATSSTCPPAASVARGGASRPQTAPLTHGHLHCSTPGSPTFCPHRPGTRRATGLVFRPGAAGRVSGSRSPDLLRQEGQRGRPWTSQPYCEGIRKGLAPSPATDFIRATAKSSFQAKTPNAPRLRQACERIVLAQSQSRRACFKDTKLAPVPPIEVVQSNYSLHSNEDSPRLRYKQQLMYL